MAPSRNISQDTDWMRNEKFFGHWLDMM